MFISKGKHYKILMEAARIVKTKGTVGGKARIDGTRVRVIDIVQDYEVSGNAIPEIADNYNLSSVQVLEALKYYYQHPEEIREEIRSEKNLLEKFKKEGKVIVFQHS